MSASASQYMEVPLFSPLINRAPASLCFEVSDTNCSIQHASSNENFVTWNVSNTEVDVGASNGKYPSSIGALESIEKQQLKGCASASIHPLHPFKNPYKNDCSILVTTCAIPIDPHILSISVIPKNEEGETDLTNTNTNRHQQNGYSSRAELDLSKLKQFGPFPIKTTTFVELEDFDGSTNSDISMLDGTEANNQQQYRIRLNLIDAKGRVIVLRLNYSTSHGIHILPSNEYPAVELHDFPFHTLLPATTSSAFNSPTSSLTSSNDSPVSFHLVEWLSPEIVVFARKSMIICADLKSDRILEWNPTTTISMSNSRRSTLTSVLSLIARSSGEEDQVMAPVSALSSASGVSDAMSQNNQNNQNSQNNQKRKKRTRLFSLHTDGTVRMWVIKLDSYKFKSNLYPESMRLIRVHRNCLANTLMGTQLNTQILENDEIESCDPPLPESTLWNTEFDSISMTSRLYAENARTFALAIAIKTLSPLSPTSSSPLSIMILHGDANAKEMQHHDFCLVLTAPPNVDNLTQMSFSPNKRCELFGLFTSEHGSNAVFTRYPPSCMAVVDRMPEIINSTLDQWANSEMDSINSLAPVDCTVKKKDKEDIESEQLQKELEAMDSYFMRRLFSPSFLGIAGNRPFPLCIVRALHHVIPTYSQSEESEIIETHTLLTMREWARSDEARYLAITRHDQRNLSSNEKNQDASTASIYHAFSTPQKRSRTNHVGEGYENKKKLEMHHDRWKKFLLAVWKEHISFLTPLTLLAVSSDVTSSSSILTQNIVIRSGVTSIMAHVEDYKNNHDSNEANLSDVMSSMLKLDTIAQSLQDSFVRKEECRQDILGFEKQMDLIVSSASLIAAKPESAFIEEMKRLGTTSMTGKSNIASLATKIIEECLVGSQEEKLLQWACSVPNRLPSSLHFPEIVDNMSPSTSIFNSKDPPSSIHKISSDLKLGSAYICQCYIKAVRTVTLSRCLLLCGLLETDFQFKHIIQSSMHKAIHLYLHIVAVEMVSKERMDDEIAMRTLSLMDPNRLFYNETKTKGVTVLDAYVSLVASRFSSYSIESTIQSIFNTCVAFRNDSFPKFNLTTEIEKSYFKMPPLAEMGLLKKWQQPRLGLRLLAPSIAMLEQMNPKDAPLSLYEELAKIKIFASECLLVEASFTAKKILHSDSQTRKLRYRASKLYAEANRHYNNCFEVETDDEADVDTVFYVITKSVAEWQKCTSTHDMKSGEDLDAVIVSELESLLRKKSSGFLSYPISRLAQLPTCRALILSWITAKSESKKNGLDPHLPFLVDEKPENHIRIFFHRLRTMSHLLDRLALIEKHSNDHKLILECANDAISALNSELPKDMIYDMTESATLWSATFHHAMEISEWSEALKACRNNTLSSRRKDGLRRLILGMINCGALGELLKLANAPVVDCTEGGEGDFGADGCDKGSLASSADQIDDFYEDAISILTEQSKEQSKHGQYEFTNESNVQDYRECLYALHASRGDWKRAANVMNEKFESTLSMINSMKMSKSTEHLSNATEQLSLSALTCTNSIKLVNEKHHRFLIGANNKPTNPTEEKAGNDTVLKTNSSLERQALLAMAWKNLEASDLRDTQKELDVSVTTTLDTIFKLAQNGCYYHAIVLAKSFHGAPNGEKQFSQILSFILCNYMVPVAVSLSRPTPCNAEKCGNDWESEIRLSSTPSMAQIVYALGISENQKYLSILGEQWRPSDTSVSARGKACMELVRRLTTAYSNANNTIALDVAEKMLDLDNNRAKLPIWLEGLLSGRITNLSDTTQTHSCNGLFASAPKDSGEKSDPSSLLRLYMKRGLFVAACNLVTEILGGHNNGSGRKSVAMNRIPEKGDIDFVPYATIDMLDELIQMTLDGKVGAALNSRMKQNMVEARCKMIEALEFHFELIKISEMGVQSARALIK